MEEILMQTYSAAEAFVMEHAFRVILVVIIALVAQAFSGRVIEKLIRHLIKSHNHNKQAEEKRRTL